VLLDGFEYIKIAWSLEASWLIVVLTKEQKYKLLKKIVMLYSMLKSKLPVANRKGFKPHFHPKE
jgi:hypothetical protein